MLGIIFPLHLLSQMGSFVPAREAVVGVADRLFARVGASDNVARHMSTFHVEMAETASIVSMATQNSFVVLDEIGTDTCTHTCTRTRTHTHTRTRRTLIQLGDSIFLSCGNVYI